MLRLTFPQETSIRDDLVDGLYLPVAADQDPRKEHGLLSGPQLFGQRLLRWALWHESQAGRTSEDVATALEAGTLNVRALVEEDATSKLVISASLRASAGGSIAVAGEGLHATGMYSISFNGHNKWVRGVNFHPDTAGLDVRLPHSLLTLLPDERSPSLRMLPVPLPGREQILNAPDSEFHRAVAHLAALETIAKERTALDGPGTHSVFVEVSVNETSTGNSGHL